MGLGPSALQFLGRSARTAPHSAEDAELAKLEQQGSGYLRRKPGQSDKTTVNSSSSGEGHSAQKLSLANPQDYSPQKLFAQSIWDGQDLCRDNDRVRSAFLKYIFGFAWSESVSSDISEHYAKHFLGSSARDITFNEYTVRSRSYSSEGRDMEAVATTMMRCTQLKIRDSMDSSGSYGRKSRSTRGAVDTCFSVEQLRAVVITTLWPTFHDSEAFTRALNGNDDGDESDGNRPCAEEHCLMHANESAKVKRLKEIYTITAQQTLERDLDRILVEGCWAHDVLKYIEKLPLAVSVSSAAQTCFPIVYVNKAFEESTGYLRAEALGRSHAFLQCPNTERDQVAKIASSLQRGEGCKVAITNRRKGGQEYQNFLALRPVASRETKKYLQVVAVQYDITKSEASLREIRMIDDFLALLANILKAG